MKLMKSRRLTAVTLCLVMAAALLAPAAPALAGRVPAEWAVPEVNDANTTGLLSASAAKDFEAYLTRDEFCEIVVMMTEGTLGRSLPIPAYNPFYDCDSLYVLKAWQYGIITGITTTRFAPDNYVERQQLCVMMIRAIRQLERDLGKTLLNPAAQTLAYNDAGMIEGYALESVKLAYTNNIMIGDTRNYFNPKASIQSQECVATVIRSFNRMERFITGGMTTAQLLDLAENRVHIGYAYGDTADGVSQNLTLPSISTGGATVTWASSNSAAISATGMVYPGYSAQTVTLTATIRLSNQTRTKTFALKTSQYTGDQLLMENAYSALNITYVNAGDSAESVTGRVGLPVKVLGLPVTWSSSNPGVISGAGVVNVPGGSETYSVTLTAVISNGYMTKMKTFNLTVLNPAYGRGVTLHRVGFGMSQTQVTQLLGTAVRSIQAGGNEIWRLYHSNYGSFIAVAYTGDVVSAVYSMASGVASQLRNSSGSVISVSQANSTGGVGAVSYTDGSQQYAIMVYDRSSAIGGARALYAEGQEQLLFELINAFRVRSGRTTVQWTDRLGVPSRDHSEEMGQYNYLSTTSRSGRTLQQRAADEGFDRNRFTSGNVLAGENDAVGFFQKMISTSSMRSNIVATGVTVFGTGFSGGNAGTYRNYLTYMFGSLTEITWISAAQQTASGTWGAGSVIVVSPGATATVNLTISPNGYNESFTVTSSNRDVITVSNSGTTVYVTGVRYSDGYYASGDADIVVTCNSSGNVFTFPVVVDTVYATNLSLSYSGYVLTNSFSNDTSPTELVMGTDSSITIAASAGISGTSVDWAVVEGDAAYVSRNANGSGVVTARGLPGRVVVSATVEFSPNNTITHRVIVNIVSLTVSADLPQLTAGGDNPVTSTTVRAVLSGLSGSAGFTFSSSVTSAATVGFAQPIINGSAAIVTATNTGATDLTTSISATAAWTTGTYRGSITKSVPVTVKAALVLPSSITITDETGAPFPGKQLIIKLDGALTARLDLDAVIKPDNADNKGVIWKRDDASGDFAIMSSNDGAFIFIGTGTATITAICAAWPDERDALKDVLVVTVIP